MKKIPVLLSTFPDYFPNEWQDVDMLNGFRSFYWTFSENDFSVVLKNVLLDVHDEINKQVNPVSDDNKANFDLALQAVKTNTFIGSAYDVVDTFPKKIESALNSDSRSVLQFSTAGVKNSYFSLPARTYSIDFGWYKPFKAYGDVVVGAFIYLGFALAFFKRLPEIIQGSGVVYSGFNNFEENRDFMNYVKEENLDVEFNFPKEQISIYNGSKWEEV